MSGPPDWSRVKPEHILAACKRIDEGELPKRPAGNTWLVLDGNQYPAKHVRALACHEATGKWLTPDDLSGGAETATHLRVLGFKVEYAQDGAAPKASAGVQRTKGTPSIVATPQTAPTSVVAETREPGTSTQAKSGPATVRVATACIAGKTASHETNRGRPQLLLRIARQIQSVGWAPHVLLLPGGFFYYDKHLGPQPDSARRAALETAPFAASCKEAAQILDALVVVGVDTAGWRRRNEQWEDAGDQFTVAWTSAGITGMGRKVFPVGGKDGEDGEADCYTVYLGDFGTPSRLAPFGGGRSALLCSCYDMYGATETVAKPGTRAKAIRWLAHGEKDYWGWDAGEEFMTRLTPEIGKWEQLVAQADIGLAAIHHFTRPPLPGSGRAYWQRHGIEASSKVLGGGVSFGSAHFDPPLPDPEKCVFGAVDGESLQPSKWFYVQGQAIEHERALVRLYEAMTVPLPS